jgi:PKD repeat protein
LGTITSRNWDFGDGTTSDKTNPSHTYTAAGIYTVTLTVSSATDSDSEQKVSYISLADTPITGLEMQQGDADGDPDTPPIVGQTIYFSATATGSNTQYLWDFGDGALSAAAIATGQYVHHSYNAAGVYTITLTASNSANTQVATKQITIQPASDGDDDGDDDGDEPVSALTLNAPTSALVNFAINLSASVAAGDNVSYTWDFGDGTSGSGQAVIHTYTQAGSYTVTLTASNSQGEEQVTSAIIVKYGLLMPHLAR